MEKILKNADTFLQILDTSMSPELSAWDTAHLTRALNWADHFEKIYQTYHNKAKIRKTLDEELRKLAYRNCVLINVFGFGFLEGCREFLVGKLRGNLGLGIEVYKLLVEGEEKREDSANSSKRRRIEDQVTLNALHHINSTTFSTTRNTVRILCDSIEEAERFSAQCVGQTSAPQRAITTLLTRAAQQDLAVIIQCLSEGNEGVVRVVLGWVRVHFKGVWGKVRVGEVVKASVRYPMTCQAHLEYIMTLFNLLDTHKDSQAIPPQSSLPSAITSEPASDPPTSDPSTSDPSLALVEHLVTLHAGSAQCGEAVETLLTALSQQGVLFAELMLHKLTQF